MQTLPGFEIAYGGSNDDTFTTFKIGEDIAIYLNLKLRTNTDIAIPHVNNRRNFGRIIFHTEDVDGLYLHFKSDASISELVSFENEPRMFYGVRDSFIYETQMAISYHLQGQ